MKKFILGTMLVFSLFCVGCGGSDVNMKPRAIVIKQNVDQVSMLEQVRSAVVGISAEYDDGYAVGSGVAVVDGTLVLTNNHVIEDGKNITLYFADETTSPADVLWTNTGLDVAVLKSHKQIPYLQFKSSEEVKVGQEVFAIGTPLTLQFKHSVTKGIVSAKDRVVNVESDLGDSFMQSLLQHDASINPGNSGGPLIDENGKLVGINTLKASQGEGMGFAIPVEIGQKIATKIKENEEYQQPYLGVFGFDSKIAKVYGYEMSHDGVFVVSTNGPASSLQKGDIITSFGGKDIKKLLDLRLALFDYEAGDNVEITYLRNGLIKKIKVVLQ